MDTDKWGWLHDELKDMICKRLSQKDLSSMAKVNSSWRKIALREIEKRVYCQYTRFLRISNDYKKFKDARKSELPILANSLHVTPAVSILMYDRKLRMSLPQKYERGLKDKLIYRFKKVLPNSVVVFEMDECLTTEDEDKSQDSSQFGLFGLFFPSMKNQCDATVASWYKIPSDWYLVDMEARKIAESLRLCDCKYPQQTFLIFCAPDYTSALVAHRFSDRINDSKTNMWFTNVRGPLLKKRIKRKYNILLNKQYRIVVVRISGLSVKSWTTCINLSIPREQIESELHALRRQVTFNRHCIGLLHAHRKTPFGSKHDIMRIVKQIFTGITILGFFGKKNWIDNERDELTNKFPPAFLVDEHRNWMSLIIISYDSLTGV